MNIKQTTLCYLDNGTDYLMLHRVKKENDASHDKWIGVGGKCEVDESPDECMLREVAEETGLAVVEWKYRGMVTFVSDIWEMEYMHLFVASKWAGKEIVCDEGDLQWVPKARLLDLNLWQGDKIFLHLLQQDIPFFMLKLVYRGDDLCHAKLNGRELPLENYNCMFAKK